MTLVSHYFTAIHTYTQKVQKSNKTLKRPKRPKKTNLTGPHKVHLLPLSDPKFPTYYPKPNCPKST